MGRNRIEINWETLDALLQFKPTKRFCADYLGISEDTLEKNLKEKYEMTYSEYADFKLDRTRFKIQEKAIKKALEGDKTMLIFCLKNLCMWSDRQILEANISGNANLQLVNALAKYDSGVKKIESDNE